MVLHWIIVSFVCVVCITVVSGCPCRTCDNNIADCSRSQLRIPPKNFPNGIQTINLNSNRFSVLGVRSFQKLTTLEILKLRGNRVRVVRPNAFRNFKNLITLDLANNQIVKIYGRGFFGMNTLQSLTLSNNRMRSCARIFSLIPRIFQLNLAFNQITKLGENDFSRNSNLHQLDLRNNRIRTIHRDTFKNLVNLRTLFLNNNPIATLPSLNFGSNVLHLLDLSECELTEIPKVLPSSIGDLRLGKNKLTRINQSDLANVTGLVMITLNDNQIDILEYFALGNARRLKEIWLRGNNLVYIPRGLPDSVTHLHMDSNTVFQIEGRLFSNESQLEFVDITNNQVVNISNQAFTGLTKLRTLNFQGNQLQEIKPGTFTNIHNLTVLNLANNPIEFIHDGAFSNLGNLTKLSLNYNPVEEVQCQENFLEAMPKLEKLDLMASSGMVKTLLRHLKDTDLEMEFVKEVTLTYNNLHKLASKFRDVFPNVKKVQLDGNAWICDNELLWLKQWMTSGEPDMTFYEYGPPKCETPYGLSGQEIHQVPESDFVPPDENLLNDFPYWLVEEEFKDRTIDTRDFKKEKDKEYKRKAEEKNRKAEEDKQKAEVEQKAEEEKQKSKINDNPPNSKENQKLQTDFVQVDMPKDNKPQRVHHNDNSQNKKDIRQKQGRKRKGKKKRKQKVLDENTEPAFKRKDLKDETKTSRTYTERGEQIPENQKQTPEHKQSLVVKDKFSVSTSPEKIQAEGRKTKKGKGRKRNDKRGRNRKKGEGKKKRRGRGKGRKGRKRGPRNKLEPRQNKN